MLCQSKCPKKLKCEPISNVIPEDISSIVCIGYPTKTNNKYKQDIFRHCFKTEDSDSMHDYSLYDIQSVLSIFSEAILIDNMKNSENIDLTIEKN